MLRCIGLLAGSIATLAIAAPTATPRSALEGASGDQIHAAVAFDGSNYLVVWEDHRSSGSDIYGARVTRAGRVRDPGAIAISGGPGDQVNPAIAFDGTNFLVAWSDRSSGSWDIRASSVSRAAAVLNPSGIAISAAAGAQVHPAVAFGAGRYLITWSDYRANPNSADIYGARVSAAGAVLDSNGIPMSHGNWDEFGSALAFDGANWLVTWTDGRTFDNYDVYGTRVSPVGTVLDPNGIAIGIASSFTNQRTPTLSFDGTNYFVVWEDDRGGTGLFGARVRPSGVVLDQGIPLLAGRTFVPSEPAIAYDGANYLIVWHEGGENSRDIYGARLTPTGGVLDQNGFAMSAAANAQEVATLAFDGANYLVVWQDRRLVDYDVYGSRVSPGGSTLDPDALLISTPQSPSPPTATRCTVPRVIGMRLARARARIRRANCSVGRVRYARSRRAHGHVLAQSPRAGTRRARGAKVNLVVGRR